MAGVTGFEPVHGDTKNRCLTAWLHPNADWEIIRIFFQLQVKKTQKSKKIHFSFTFLIDKTLIRTQNVLFCTASTQNDK